MNYYDSGDDTKLIQMIKQKVLDLYDGPGGPKITNARALAMMKEVESFRKRDQPDLALAMFYKINQLEPENWYVHMLWGMTFAQDKQMKDAQDKFSEAFDLAKSNRQKAEVHLELGRIYQPKGPIW